MTPGMAIVRRELLTTLRSAKSFLFVVALLLFMIWELVFTVENVIGTQRIAMGQVNASDVQTLFLNFAMAFYLGAALLIPPMAAVSICIEKQQETFDQLQTTYIRPATLAVAKLANALGVYALVITATLPVMGVSFFVVGIDWTQFVLSLAVIGASALSLAAVGIFFSAWFHRTAPAIVATYITGFVLHFGTVLLLALLTQSVLAGSWLDRVVNGTNSPVLAMLYPLFSLDLIRRGGLGLPGLLAVATYHGLIVAACLYGAVRVLRRPARPMRVNTEKPIDDPALLDARRKRFPYYLLDPRRRRPLIPDGKNPVYVRELQTSLAGWGVWRIRIAYCFGIFCFVLSVHSVWILLDQSRFVRSPFSSVMIGTLITLVFVPPAISFAMTKEYESGNADMLRMTLLEPWEIAAGKFRAAMAGIAPMLAGILFGTIPLLLTGYELVLGDLFAMALTILYTMALVAAVTAGARRTVSGLLLGYGAALFAHAALPYGALFVIEFLAPRFFALPADDAGAASFLSPFWARIYFNNGLRYGSQFHQAQPYWVLSCIVFIPLTFLLLWAARRRFQRQFNRS